MDLNTGWYAHDFFVQTQEGMGLDAGEGGEGGGDQVKTSIPGEATYPVGIINFHHYKEHFARSARSLKYVF